MFLQVPFLRGRRDSRPQNRNVLYAVSMLPEYLTQNNIGCIILSGYYPQPKVSPGILANGHHGELGNSFIQFLTIVE